MARKLKIKSAINAHPGLFDLPDLFGSDEREAMPVHPSITEYAERERDAAASVSDDFEMPATDDAATDTLLFISFGSGSSGNCAYIGTRENGVLIDAGVDPSTVRDALKDNGISVDAIKGICLTHDHSDHIRYVYTMVRKHPLIGVYCTPKTLNGLLRRHNISRRIKDYHRAIYKEFPFNTGGLEITAFDVSHDGTDNAGFFITNGKHRFAIATDLGCITPRVEYYMSRAQHIMLESNYDAAMLASGPYPQYLKARIAAERGHLDNTVAGAFLGKILTPRLQNVFLCHLSQDNNTPEIALDTVRQALIKAGTPGVGDGSGSIESRRCPVQLVALPRYGASTLFMLRAEQDDL